MRPLILASSLLFMVLVGVAKAEEVYLNYKFDSGTLESTRHGLYRWQKGDIGTDDINIIMDIKKKKLINAPHYISKFDNSTMEFKGGKDIFSSSWSDNEIKWIQRQLEWENYKLMHLWF